MAQPHPEPSAPHVSGDPREGMQRSAEQAAREAAMREVSETLLNIEQVIRRVEQAQRAVNDTTGEPNLNVALASSKQRLEEAHKALFQLGYFGGPQQRMF